MRHTLEQAAVKIALHLSTYPENTFLFPPVENDQYEDGYFINSRRKIEYLFA